MKELSIEEKAKRYDKALKVLHKYDGANIMFSQSLKEEMFPELKESEDERIKKALYLFVEAYGAHSQYATQEDMLAWIERQGEQKPVVPKFKIGDVIRNKWSNHTKKIVRIADDNSVYFLDDGMPGDYISAPISDQENWVLIEQKPADKVEPKFHEGDWVVSEVTGKVYQIKKCIENLSNHKYGYDLINGGYICSDEVNNYHLWTIEDAKDGDVLSVIFDEWCKIVIFLSLNNNNVEGYGITLKNGELWFTDNDVPYYSKTWTNCLTPATKEQRDLLFQKMKEAGYEWDADKKELKKIEQKPAWSEEDENILKDVIIDVKFEGHNNDMQANSYRKINWLKSLKDRVQAQPKQEWKQENTGDLTDFENAMMHIGGSFFGENAGLDPNDTNTIKEQANLLLELVPKQEWSEEDEKHLNRAINILDASKTYTTSPEKYEETINWLKFLKDRYTWKPSDEQMEVLWSATEKYLESDNEYVRKLRGEVLESLYEQLKKLREE